MQMVNFRQAFWRLVLLLKEVLHLMELPRYLTILLSQTVKGALCRLCTKPNKMCDYERLPLLE